MRVSRQPKVSALFRIFAGTCALLWLMGIAVSGIGRVCTCAGHEGACAAHASPIHEHDAVSPHEQGRSHDAEHHHDAEVHQHATASHHDGAASQHCAGKNGCNDKCRCSASIQALITTMTPVVISKPISQPVLYISLLCAARQYAFAAPPSEPLRRATPRDWVFTPEVCLGPAFHSLAPPAFV
jgi:hypothetical protein